MTEKQAIRYFNREARYYERGPVGPYYGIVLPVSDPYIPRQFLCDQDVAKLADKFYAAVGLKATGKEA